MTDWTAALRDIESVRDQVSLETLLTHPDYFNLPQATPLQRGLCRLIEGVSLGDLKDHPHVLESIGDTTEIEGKKPFEVAVCAGIRSGKSLLNAACIMQLCLTCDLSKMRPGEIPRCPIVSVDKKSAQQTLSHLTGSSLTSPKLRGLIREGTGERTGSWIFTQPKSGKEIEICVVANRKEGLSLVSVWNVGGVFEEAARMADASEGVINLEDARKAVLGRFIKGGQIFYTSSPTAPSGYFYEMVSKNIRKSTPKLLVAQCRGDWMNPDHWTPEKVEEYRIGDPDVYVTDVLGQFASPESSMFPLHAIDLCTRKGPDGRPSPDKFYQPEQGLSYRAAIDPATRSNGFTLVISTRIGNKRIVVYAQEWRGSKETPLNTLKVIPEVVSICHRYGITAIESDQFILDPVNDVARASGATIYHIPRTRQEKWKLEMETQQKMIAGLVEIPYDSTLRADLLRARKLPLPSGDFKIDLPRTSDGRHADYVPAFCLSVGGWIADENRDAPDTYAARLKEDRFRQIRVQTQLPKRQQIRNVLAGRGPRRTVHGSLRD